MTQLMDRLKPGTGKEGLKKIHSAFNEKLENRRADDDLDICLMVLDELEEVSENLQALVELLQDEGDRKTAALLRPTACWLQSIASMVNDNVTRRKMKA